MKSSLDFIEKVCSQQCENGDYVILSAKGPGVKWKDLPVLFHKDSFRKKVKKVLSEYPPNKFDLYWSPMPYSKPYRRLENALDTKFLVQDIDEHESPKQLNPKPTYIWESSPNKYQGMWELDRYISEEEYTPLNKALAKHIGCDDCFDFCHVYRIPGTINHKYKNNPQVSLPTNTKKIYKPKALNTLLKVGIKPKERVETSSSNIDERKIYAKYSIPKKVRDLLALDNLSGLDRSSTIWYIENKLHELGMSPNEIIYLVKNSTFNKYKGRRDEDSQLRKELDKIISGKINSSIEVDDKSKLKITTYSDVMGSSDTFEGWLVKGFWGRRSHGIVAGMPKCFKSTLVHDLVVSVASGKPFLGKFPVLEPGPVVVVQNENADYVMKDRTEKLILHRGVQGKVSTIDESTLRMRFPKELPISFVNQQGFTLTNSDHQKQLEEIIKTKKPVLVVLDPLYLMFEGDLNSAKDLNPILNWLLYIKNTYKTSVMLIHHYNKGSMGAAKGGSRMMGSIILYGWIESAWYLSKEEVEENYSVNQAFDDGSTKPSIVTMAREFRMAGSFPEIDIHLEMGEIGNPHYDTDVTPSGDTSMKKDNIRLGIVNLLSNKTHPTHRTEIARELGLDERKVRDVIEAMVSDGVLKNNKGKGFVIYKE